MRVLCLTRTAMRAYLSPPGPSREGAAATRAQRPRRAQRAAHAPAARNSSCAGAVEHHAHDRERPLPRRPAASHTDSMSTAIAPAARSCARRSPSASRDTHTIVPRAHLQPAPVERARSSSPRHRTARAHLVVPFVGGRVAPPRRRSLPRPELRVEARRRSRARAAPRPARAASSPAAACARAGPMPVLRTRAPRARRARSAPPPARSGAATSRSLTPRSRTRIGLRRRQRQRSSVGPSASRAPAAWPLSTAPSSVAGQPVSVQAPASTSPGDVGARRRAQRRARRAPRGTSRRARA